MTEPVPAPPEEGIPLSPPNPQLIQQVFAKDPLEMTDEDLDLIIAELRSDRLSYRQPPEEKKAERKAAAKRAKGGAAPVDLLDILSEL